MKILALSGSLRAASMNSALLRAMVRLSPPTMRVLVYGELGRLPLFNPDIEPSPPSVVGNFHHLVATSDALIIASPEYAHGVTGAIKNALDWLVGFAPFAGKPVAVLNTSARARHADEAIRETLKTMAAQIVEPASIAISLLGAGLDEDGLVNTPSIADEIRRCLSALHKHHMRSDDGSNTSDRA